MRSVLLQRQYYPLLFVGVFAVVIAISLWIYSSISEPSGADEVSGSLRLTSQQTPEIWDLGKVEEKPITITWEPKDKKIQRIELVNIADHSSKNPSLDYFEHYPVYDVTASVTEFDGSFGSMVGQGKWQLNPDWQGFFGNGLIYFIKILAEDGSFDISESVVYSNLDPMISPEGETDIMMQLSVLSPQHLIATENQALRECENSIELIHNKLLTLLPHDGCADFLDLETSFGTFDKKSLTSAECKQSLESLQNDVQKGVADDHCTILIN